MDKRGKRGQGREVDDVGEGPDVDADDSRLTEGDAVAAAAAAAGAGAVGAESNSSSNNNGSNSRHHHSEKNGSSRSGKKDDDGASKEVGGGSGGGRGGGSNKGDEHKHSHDHDHDHNDDHEHSHDREESDEESEEDAEDYRVGGYHPVRVGDVFKGRYRVVDKLGWGHFSTVWLAHDSSQNRYVALKVVKSASHYREAAEDEIKLLRAVRDTNPRATGRQRVVMLLDDFVHHGPNGAHVCMIMEILGCTLLHLIKEYKYRGLPSDVLKRIVRQILEGLDYLHTQCRIIHTDIKPENILVCLTEEEIASMTATAELLAKSKPVQSAGRANPVGSSSAPAKPLSKTQKKNQKRRQKQKTAAASSSGGAAEDGADDDQDGDDTDKPESTSNTDSPAAASASSSASGKPANGADGAAPMQVDAAAPKPERFRLDVRSAEFARTVNVKIADLGNACWVERHFSEDIQTRQYRSLEAILGSGYDSSADVWSVACMIFELATGDYLFEPHTGDNYSRDEDHVALIIELLGNVPRHIALSGKHSRDIFNKKGELRHIRKLKPWPLKDVLQDHYHFEEEEAKTFADFLVPMLDLNPLRRATPSESLKHRWLSK
eukprot:m.149135 g.149135  ORF g.149135 m.149135 type:complete len:604 (+) comp16850_c0_seq1:145-1956(+)